MDKKIRQIEREVPKKGKAHKDLKELEKMDKKQDNKIEKCDKMMGKTKKSHAKKKNSSM